MSDARLIARRGTPRSDAKLTTNTDMREGTKQPKDIEKPQYYRDDNNAVQDGLNRSLHRYETIDQPEQNTHNNQNHHYLQ
jgi:hypothetical protein